MSSVIAALIVLGLFGAAWAFADFLKDAHEKRMAERHQQLSKDLTLERPSTKAWRKHAGIE